MTKLEQGQDGEPSISDQRSFWNDWNTDYRLNIPLPVAAQKRGRAVLSIVESLHLQEPKILDIGCGNGWLCGGLSKYGPVTGIDLADKAVAAARQQYPDVRFMAGDFLDAPLGRSEFDVVLSLETIAHVVDKTTFCQHVADILKPGGYFIVTTQNRFVWNRTTRLRQDPKQIQNFLSMRQLKAKLRRDFRILRSSTLIPAGDTGILRYVNSYKLNRFASLIFSSLAVERWKEKMGLGNTLVVLAQKRK